MSYHSWILKDLLFGFDRGIQSYETIVCGENSQVVKTIAYTPKIVHFCHFYLKLLVYDQHGFQTDKYRTDKSRHGRSKITFIRVSIHQKVERSIRVTDEIHILG